MAVSASCPPKPVPSHSVKLAGQGYVSLYLQMWPCEWFLAVPHEQSNDVGGQVSPRIGA